MPAVSSPNEEIKKIGYVPLVKAFRIKFSDSSNFIITTDEVAAKLEEWIPRNEFSQRVNLMVEEEIRKYRPRKKRYYDYEKNKMCDYDGSIEAKKKMLYSKYSRFPEFEHKRSVLKKLIRKAENDVRANKGFNAVGALITESVLYSKIKSHFPQYNVMSQFRPQWLGRQSLDIFIEELNIAIEYQGDQHTQPVDYFGGIEGFERTQQRDKKKLLLCQRNGCKLLYVYPGYEFSDVVKEIHQLIK